MRAIYIALLLLFTASSFTGTEDERNEAFITAIKNLYAPLLDRLGMVSVDSLRVISVKELTETEFNLLALEILERKHDFVLERFTTDTSCVTSMNDYMRMETEISTGNYEYFKQRRDECASEIDSLRNELPKYVKAVDSCKQLLMVTNRKKQKGYLVTVYIVQHNKERPAVREYAKYIISDNMVASYLTSSSMKRYYQN